MRTSRWLAFACATALALVLAQDLLAQDSSTPPKNASKTPHYTFSDTLEQQLEELKTNPLLQRFHDSRAAKADDPHRPIYHYVNPEGRLNDPNGLCHWQGRWHLFYQAYPLDDPRQHWGHVVSDDLVHWRDLPLAIYPGPERACFSGATFVEEDRVILFNMNPGIPSPKGALIWNQIMTLPRRLTLASDDPLNNLYIEPAGDIELLRREHVHVGPRTLPANTEVVLDTIRDNAMELEAVIDPKGANVVELDVLRSPHKEEYTRILFYKGRGNRHREWGRLDQRARKIDSVITIDA